MLNACWSEGQARAIQPHVDFVIGMARPIRDDAAIRFAAGFYRGLGVGLGVEAAFKLGRNEMSAGAGATGAGGGRHFSGQAGDAPGQGGSTLRDIPRLLPESGADLDKLVSA